MVDLEVACHCWKDAFKRTTVDKHPTIWVGHFRQNTYLYSFWHWKRSEETALWLSGPFTVTDDIDSTVIAVDVGQKLKMTRLYSDGNGARITNWLIPYHIDDAGTPHFHHASYEHDPHYPVAVDSLVRARLSGEREATWTQAYQAVVQI